MVFKLCHRVTYSVRDPVRGFCTYALSAFERREYQSATANAFSAVEHMIIRVAQVLGDELAESHRARMWYLTVLVRRKVVPEYFPSFFSKLVSLRNKALYLFANGEIAGEALEIMCRFAEVFGRIVGEDFAEVCCK